MNRVPRDVAAEGLLELFRRDLAERGEPSPAGVGEEDVQAPAPLCDGLDDAVQVLQFRDVTGDPGDAGAEQIDGGVEFRLPAPGDEHVRALGDEATRRRQADARGGSGDQCGLAVQLSHDRSFSTSGHPPFR